MFGESSWRGRLARLALTCDRSQPFPPRTHRERSTSCSCEVHEGELSRDRNASRLTPALEQNMDSLQFFSHAAPHPPFTAIIDFLNAQSSLVGIQAQVFADEVFRLLRPRPLQIIAMDATPGLVHKSMFHYLDVAPINVDVARRAPTKFATVPAPVARQTALVEGLAPLLVASASSLKVFDFDDESDSVRDLLPRLFSEIRLRGQAPIFPALTRLTLGGLALNGRDFKNLLITSTELTHLVIRDQTKTALEPPESGLSKLVLL